MHIASTISRCREALSGDDLLLVSQMLAQEGVDEAIAESLLHGVNEVSASQEALLELKRRLSSRGLDETSTCLERYLLLRCVLDSLSRLRDQPLSDEVKGLMCAEYHRYAEPKHEGSDEFRAGCNAFQATCKIATLRRFAAGQFDWEVSGIPRSWFLRLRHGDILRLPRYVALRLKGRGPLFFRHFGVRRPMILRERAANLSYYRMAESMRLQPDIRGFAGSGWLSSPDTHEASPHLKWVNATICSNGGMVVRIGPASPTSGVLAKSPERQQLYESGYFRPTMGLVVWDRQSMLSWADKVAGTMRAE